jgi:tetraacyldisaccharide 4'-kinase
MTTLKTFLHRLIRNPGENLPSRILLAPLTFLSFLYGLAVTVRVFFYRKGIYRSRSLPCRVVSVGNLTLGGTGKTPFVILLAEMIRRRGYRAAVLSRGYRGKYEGPFALVSDGDRILMDPLQAGDEPCLLARKLKGVPVIVGRERWVAGRFAIDRFRTEVLILDDGFQHLALNRDLNFLLLDSFSPFGNGRLFPRGELREPLSQVHRADALILTKGGADDMIINLGKRFMNLSEGKPVFRVRYEPGKIIVWGQERVLSALDLKKKRILAFSGLARPESFEKTLRGLEAEIVGFETFPDHYAYEGKDLERLREKALRAGAEAMVTTEKDMVRIQDFPPGTIPLWALSVRHVFPEEDLTRFETFLFERLDRNA